MTHPIVLKAMILALQREGGLNTAAAAELAPKLIHHLHRHRVIVMPEALLKSPEQQGLDPFMLLAEMVQEIESSGRTPWLPEG